MPLFYRAILIFIIFSHPKIWANNVAVFDVRKPIALDNSQKVYKDYYINAGTELGIKRGYVVTVVRNKSLYDAYSNKSPGDLMVPVGRLKIIHSQKGLCVGRLESLYSREKIPVIDYDYIMIGDRLDMATLKKPSRTKKSASTEVQKKKVLEKKISLGPEAGVVDFASSIPLAPKNVILPTMQ